MKSPSSSNSIYLRKRSESDDSDLTFFSDSPKKKHKKSQQENHIEGDENMTNHSQASESLLKVKKKKYFEMSGELSSEDSINRHKKKKNSFDLFSQDIFTQHTCEDLVNSSPKKIKNENKGANSTSNISQEKIIKEEILHDLVFTQYSRKKDKNKKNSFDITKSSHNDDVDFCTQDSIHRHKKKKNSSDLFSRDIFTQHSCEDLVNSSPKKIKKEKKRANSTSDISQEKIIKEEISHDVVFTQYSRKKDKNKKNSFDITKSSHNDDVDFCTQNVFKQPSSEEFICSTPKKIEKRKELINNSDDIKSPVNKTQLENNWNSLINGHHVENFSMSSTRKEKKKRRKVLNLNNISQNGNSYDSESFNNSLPYTSDSNQSFSELHTTLNISDDDSKIFSEFDESEIKSPSKHKKQKKKHKEIKVENNSFGDNVHEEIDDSFHCQFCRSSYKGIKQDGSGTFSNECVFNHRISGVANGKDDSETLDESDGKPKKKKQKKKKLNMTKKKDSLALLEKYLDKTSDDDSTSTEVAKNSLSPDDTKHDPGSNGISDVTNGKDDSETLDESHEKPKKKKQKKKKLNKTTKKEGSLTLLEEYLDKSSDDDSKSTEVAKNSLSPNDTKHDPGCSNGMSAEKLEIPNENTSNNYSERSNGNNACFDDSDDSDEGVEDMGRLEVLKDRLKDLVIELDFPVPELHKICNRASKPTPQQRSKLVKEKIPVKNGKFVKEEDKKIKENWREFIHTYNFEDVPEVFYSLDKKYISIKEKQNFLFFLAKGLNDRTPYSVYQRFKLLMTQVKRGRFTEEEDKYIADKIEESGGRRGKNLIEIAQHLQRPIYSIERRIKRLKDRHTRNIRWKNQNAGSFIKYLLKVTGTDPDDLETLKNRHISCQEWMGLSRKLDGVPVRILKRVWLEKIHPKLFIPDNTCDLRDVKLKLIKMFYENKEYDWRAVNWKSYVSHFEGLTTLRLYSLVKTLVQSKVPPEKRKNLKRCVKVLKNCSVEDLKQHFIFKIRYENGEVRQLASKENYCKKKKG